MVVFNNIIDLFQNECKSNYIDNNKYINSGIGRKVYKYDNSKVIKFSINKFGKGQNKNECKTKNFDDICAKVYNHANDYSWLVMEKIEIITKEQFENTFKSSAQTIEDYFISQYCKMFPNSKSTPVLKDFYKCDKISVNKNLQNNHVIQRVLELMKHYQLEPHDICKHNSWGMRNKTLALYDYGLNTSLWQKYYTRKITNESDGSITLRVETI